MASRAASWPETTTAREIDSGIAADIEPPPCGMPRLGFLGVGWIGRHRLQSIAASGLAMRNVGGSFYDFRTEQFIGTSRKPHDEPPDDWGGKAALAWVSRLARARNTIQRSNRLRRSPKSSLQFIAVTSSE